MKKVSFIKFLILFSIFILSFSACATKGQVKPAEQAAITGIIIEDNTLSIEANRPFSYTIYRSTEDPFKLIAELQDVAPGVLVPGEKITSDKKGITEIAVFLMEGRGLKLEIALQAPLKEEAEFRDNVLTVRFIEESQPVAEALPEEPEKIELLPVEEKSTVTAPEEKKAEDVQPVLPPAKEIRDIKLSKKNGIVEVEILGDGELKPNVFPLDKRIVIDIAGTVSKAKAPEAIAPLRSIRIGKHPDKTRIVLDMSEKTSYEVSGRGDRLVVAVMTEAVERVNVEKKDVKIEKTVEAEIKSEVQAEAKTQKVEDKAVTPVEIPVQPVKYKGKKISLDFQDADITAILRLIGDVSGYNVVIHPDVKGKITLKLLNVPWDQALDLILKTHGLDAIVEGNVMRIAPHAVLAREYEEKAKAAEAGIKAEPLVTKVYSVNFADPKDVEKFIKDAKALSPRGSISIDTRTSSLIIRDVESAFPEIEKLLKSIDKPTPQVLIDARIVEVNSNFVRELGIQWGINWLSPNTLLRIGGPAGLPGGSGFTGTNFMVNLPAAVTQGSGGAIGLGYINAQRTLSLDLQLSALEGTGKGKVVSNPRIVTLDNKEAIIRQGKQIPVQTVSAEGTQTTTLNAVLELKVKPHITPDGSIQMTLDTKKDEPDFTRLVGGIPTIDTKQASTDVLIKDGETLVIGGIFKKTEQVSEGGVPLLSKIPILGWLFKKRRESEDTSELLIFITPRVIK
ncbi:MAG: type IV pilus secretin PilQ [Thermodesulfovibrionales bacterium]|nr:type IV pilus secretin PilQ [Thermodesulfovibrionales bacterium]